MFILCLPIRLRFGRWEPKVTYLQRATTLRAEDPPAIRRSRAAGGKLFRRELRSVGDGGLNRLLRGLD